jgi:hypothetical protein
LISQRTSTHDIGRGNVSSANVSHEVSVPDERKRTRKHCSCSLPVAQALVRRHIPAETPLVDVSEPGCRPHITRTLAVFLLHNGGAAVLLICCIQPSKKLPAAAIWPVDVWLVGNCPPGLAQAGMRAKLLIHRGVSMRIGPLYPFSFHRYWPDVVSFLFRLNT